MRRVCVPEQKRFVIVSGFPQRKHRPNHTGSTYDFVRRPILEMSVGLKNTALDLPPFTADVEEQYWWMQWIETQAMQKHQTSLA